MRWRVRYSLYLIFVVSSLSPFILQLGVLDISFVTYINPVNIQSIEDLYVQVISWDEGIGNFGQSVTEIVSIARQLNATMVEPCIKGGRLTRCTHSTTLRYSDVFDADNIRRFVRLITEEDFQIAIAAKINVTKTQMCVHEGLPPAETFCKFPNHYSNNQTIQFVQKASHDRKTSTSILEIEHYRKGGFESLKAMPLNMDNVLAIKPKLYEKFEQFRVSLGLPKNYTVFHWRGEVMSAGLMECVHELVKSKVTRIGNDSNPVYLMSSFSKSKSLQWNTNDFVAQHEGVNKALDFLSEHNFKKLDNILTEMDTPDQISLTVYDLIAAEKASDFITCSGSCGGICNQCNHDGSFPKLAMKVRTLVDKTSHNCWLGD